MKTFELSTSIKHSSMVFAPTKTELYQRPFLFGIKHPIGYVVDELVFDGPLKSFRKAHRRLEGDC
jgi:hypothetical protein